MAPNSTTHAGEEEIASRLLAPFDRFDLLLDPKLDRLPLRSLSWENFERLIGRLAVAGSSSYEMQSMPYGRPGQKQHGIDFIILQKTGTQSCVTFYQVKRVARVRPSALVKWVDKFLTGTHATAGTRFVLCTSSPVHDTRVVDAWTVCQERLAQRDIAGTLWGEKDIQERLRECPSVVAELYSDDVARRFCRTPDVLLPPETLFRTRHVGEPGRFVRICDRTVSLEIGLPNATHFHMTAVLSFARPDLKGAIVQVAADELVTWLQASSEEPGNVSPPYLIPLHGDSGRVLFTSRSARFALEPHEAENLRWVLTSAKPIVLETARSACDAWRVHRFPRIGNDSSGRPIFCIARVDRTVWLAALEFSQRHHHSKGDSKWHIFDSTPACLKVYTANETSELNAGYHLFSYAYSDSRFVEPSNNDVLIGWTPPSRELTEPREGARGHWDAEFAHRWLLTRFLPRVLEDDYETCLRQWKRSWWQWPRGQPPVRIDVGCIARSAAEAGAFKSAIPINTMGALASAVRELQSFFSWACPVRRIPAAEYSTVLAVLSRLAPLVRSLDTHYIRSNLGLTQDETIEKGVHRLIARKITDVSSSEIDLALRALLAVVEEVEGDLEGDRVYASQQLGRLWSRLQEHLLLRHWKS